jgi:Cu/Ag efflux pump CusA
VLRAQVDRLAVARFGANASDVLDAVETVGGRTVGEVLEGRRRFALRVRLAPELRNELPTIERLPVRTVANVPFAATGGILALVARGLPFRSSHRSASFRWRSLAAPAQRSSARSPPSSSAA